ncbi:MAG TPA: EamA family transporter [Candidatus Binatia bacterium]|jgi:drug/metabolite transporter (DMT)-like permease|nr:EamA family transporter [Candidatus Binatia bacterium]
MSHFVLWSGIATVVVTSTIGDVLQSRAMKEIGDLGLVRQEHGLWGVMRRVAANGRFTIGLGFMAIGFFSLLITLSWGDVSIVGPASASLTFIANALAARLYLKERVDHRRWMAAMFVAAGVFLLAR